MPSIAFRRPALPRRALVAAAALALAGCGDSTGPGADPGAISSLPRTLTPAEQEIVATAGTFGLDLMARVVATDDRPNIVLSPLSASMALGMTLNGAAGTTLDGMRSALGFGAADREAINAGYESLIDLLMGLDPAVEFGIANSVWANRDFPFHQSFFDAVREAFDAAVETRDFTDPATLAAINGWVDGETGGLIPKLLDRLDPDLRMILLNAIYLDAAWTEAFDPADTSDAGFTRADGSEVTVRLMSRTEVTLPFTSGPGYVAVELPYGGGAFTMVVVVPAEDGDVGTLVADLRDGEWDRLVANLAARRVDLVALPKFTLAHDAFLNPVLADMGMAEAFTPMADFTDLSPRGDELCIDFVRQKTFIEVDEAGTRAAAATAVGIGPESFVGLRADRPFFFAIRERLSGTLLFTGVVGDPTVEDSGPQEGEGTCH